MAEKASHGRLKVVVIGAGPVGALAALYAAKRGHEVEVYELRDDLRLDNTTPLNFTKSINLALSERGIHSIRQAQCPGLLDAVLADTTPMHSRMVHSVKNGALTDHSQRYDAFGRFQRAADRAGLNKRLLDELEGMPNVKLLFNHKLTGADFARNLAWLEDRLSPHPKAHTTLQTKASGRPNEIEIAFDLLIGADGAHSAARYHLMKFARVSYEQRYIDTLWCEFHIAPTPAGAFAIDPHHLHIWPSPSRSFMFIAIPSADASFTCTLFMPAAHFAHIGADAPARLVPFFDANFPGVADRLIPAAQLQRQFATNPHLPLISIKCAPYHYGSSAVIVGDAAHAMVPFYGQGMNAGLEDVRVLFDFLDAHGQRRGSEVEKETDRQREESGVEKETDRQRRADRAAALAAYTAARAPDAHAINDLALLNYEEMRSSVHSRAYLFKKRVEEVLSVRAPWLGFATQYARVSFSNEPYAQVVASVERQGWILTWAAAMLGAAMLGGAAAALKQWRSRG